MSAPVVTEEMREAGTAGAAARASLPPECPRCGYDLSGMVATWQLACPLVAGCSECGEEFESGLVLGLRAPWWSFEHAERGRVRRWVGTSWRALWPSFWRRMDPELPVRRMRLAIFALIYLSFSVPIAHLMVVGISLAVSGTRMLSNDPERWLWQLVWPYDSMLDLTYFLSILVAILFGMALPIVLLTVLTPVVTYLFFSSFGAIPGRSRLLLRSAGYGLTLLTMAALLYAVLLGPLLNAGTPGMIALMTLIYLVGPGWLLFWWRSFLKHQLGTRHPGFAAFVLLILAFVGTALITEAIQLLLGGAIH